MLLENSTTWMNTAEYGKKGEMKPKKNLMAAIMKRNDDEIEDNMLMIGNQGKQSTQEKLIPKEMKARRYVADKFKE